jgi:hypothetical protein
MRRKSDHNAESTLTPAPRLVHWGWGANARRYVVFSIARLETHVASERKNPSPSALGEGQG